VPFDGFLAEDQTLGDLAVGESFGNELDDLELAAAEGGEAGSGVATSTPLADAFAQAAELAHGMSGVAVRAEGGRFLG
jgi:hypothetical protein